MSDRPELYQGPEGPRPFLKCLPCNELYPWTMFPEVESEEQAWEIANAKEFTELVCEHHDIWKDD